MLDEYANDKNAAKSASKLADMSHPSGANTMPGSMAGAACRQSSKTLLLKHAERLRREAFQLEALAYQVEHIHGEAEAILYRLLAGVTRT